jgi:hypothetical protein
LKAGGVSPFRTDPQALGFVSCLRGVMIPVKDGGPLAWRTYQRSAAVCTGASHSAFSSSFNIVTVIDAPAISSDVV